MKLIINYALGFFGVLALCNLIIVNFFDTGFINVTSSQEDLGYDLAISYLTGYFVYFLTVLLPKYQLDNSNKEILLNELDSIESFIKRRLDKITGLDDKDDKEIFVKALSKHFYGDKINDKEPKTYQQAIQEIFFRVNRLIQYEAIVLESKKSSVYDNYVKIIKFVFKSGDYYNFVNKESKEIANDKIKIGKTIHNLYHDVISLKNSL